MKRVCLIDSNTNKGWLTLCKEIKRNLEVPYNKEILVSLHFMILVELSDMLILSAGNLSSKRGYQSQLIKAERQILSWENWDNKNWNMPTMKVGELRIIVIGSLKVSKEIFPTSIGRLKESLYSKDSWNCSPVKESRARIFIWLYIKKKKSICINLHILLKYVKLISTTEKNGFKIHI